MRRALQALKDAGCKRVFIDGSFVTSMEMPGDFDGCWDHEGVDFDALDPALLDFTGYREAQKPDSRARCSSQPRKPTRWERHVSQLLWAPLLRVAPGTQIATRN